MIIVIRRSAPSVERVHLLTLLCQVRGCQRPIATTKLHQRDVIAPDRTSRAVQASLLISQQSAGEHLIPSKTPYQFVRQAFQATNSPIVVGNAWGGRQVVIGNGTPTSIAGPCTVATREHQLAPAYAGRAASAPSLRAGAFKPLNSPSQFQGRGVLGLQLLAEARQATDLPSIAAVMEPGVVETVVAYADGLQLGSRIVLYFPLLVAAGQHRPLRPVLLTRGLYATTQTWRRRAAPTLAASHRKVILCERGRHSLDRKSVSCA